VKRFNPKEIEPKWQKAWADKDLYKAIDFSKRPKFVMLTEFPYPSGDGLHLGHIREYTYGDIIARQKRMQGNNVLYPMGYDAFGLPTQNYAIKNKITPQEATDTNIANFQKQFENLGFSFDWSRSFRTSDPSYYKWTQWLFLKFFEKGLAYQDETAINWCPHCKTGLSNEEVINGRHERCDTLVEKKILKQWLLKITDYAERLINGLKEVDYPPRIADQQINWIGKSVGAELSFYEDSDKDSKSPISVFTTRQDTIYGATFLVLAPEHPMVGSLTKTAHKDRVFSYIKTAVARSDIERQDTKREKTGVFTGAHAINPFTKEPMPIWIADYVLINYGSGAIMAVPAHDERDWDFAKKHDLPIRRVIANSDPIDHWSNRPGKLINSGEFDGMDIETAKKAILEYASSHGFGEAKVQYKLRDWIFSRQHYWGEPIPIIHCPDHGAVAVPETDLPVILPEVADYEALPNGDSPLSAVEEWVNVTCPICGGPAKRETDTMPNWAGSSWYYMRYYDPTNDKEFAGRDKLDYWKEVDLYLGGMEHTTLHLLYSRFWHQFFYDQGLVPTKEPYAARRGQGIILAADGSKMSKSKGNVISPSEVIDSGYGADALRLAIAFLAPYDQTTPWNPEGVAGTYRFLQRVWQLVQTYLEGERELSEGGGEEVYKVVHRAIKRVSGDLSKLSFNTAIAAQMELMNALSKLLLGEMPAPKDAWKFALESVLLMLAPFAPHMSEELWAQLGYTQSIHISPWPEYDEKYLIEDEVTIAVQVDGKLRGQFVVAKDADQQTIVDLAKDLPKVAQYIGKNEIKKTIYVKGKIVNFVL